MSAIEAVPVGRHLTDLVVITRVPSCVAGGVSVLLGIHLATGGVLPDWWEDIVAAASMFFAVAAANAVNDVVDKSVDTLAKPWRPLPSGRLSVRAALLITCSLALTAILLTTPLGGEIVLWMAGLLMIATSYSLYFKSTVLLGNIVVALCASSPIVFGSAVVHNFTAPVFVATGLAFVFMLSYETLKTIVDRNSDAAGGVRTFATKLGERRSIYLLRFLVAGLTAAAFAAGVVQSPSAGISASSVRHVRTPGLVRDYCAG